LCIVQARPEKKARTDQGQHAVQGVKARWLTFCKNTNTKCNSCHEKINTNEVTVVVQMQEKRKITTREAKEMKVIDERHFHFEHRPLDCNQQNTILDQEHFTKKGRGGRLMSNPWGEAQTLHGNLPRQ